jgi:hypothetical protein
MAGYAARTGPSTGTLDELTIGALVLEYDQGRLVLIAVDISAVDTSLVAEIATAAGLDDTELIICASHTHSGPAGIITRMHPGDADRLLPALRADFVRRCVQAIERARERAEPVELVFGQAETSGLAANRNGLDGCFDPHVSVLATRNQAGALTAVLVHFACHPTILSAANREVSADYPGVLRLALEADLAKEGPAPIVLFANGAAGDISTRFTRQSQDRAEVERVGRGVATAALAALAVARPAGSGIGCAAESVRLTPRSLDASDQPTVDMPVSNAPDSIAERRKAETQAQGAMLLEWLTNAGGDAIQSRFDLRGWRLGDIDLIAVPGELFASLGARIVTHSATSTLVLGYANGYVGYLVDDAAHAGSTYEALASPFTPSAGETVVQTASSVLEKLAFIDAD